MGGVLVLTTAFYQRYRDTIGSFAGWMLRVRTEHGVADIPRVSAAAATPLREAARVHCRHRRGRGRDRAAHDRRDRIALLVAAGVAALDLARRHRHRPVAGDLARRRRPAHAVGTRDAVRDTGRSQRARSASRSRSAARCSRSIGRDRRLAAVPDRRRPESRAADPASTSTGSCSSRGFGALVVVVLVIALVDGLRTARATRPDRRGVADPLRRRGPSPTSASHPPRASACSSRSIAATIADRIPCGRRWWRHLRRARGGRGGARVRRQPRPRDRHAEATAGRGTWSRPTSRRGRSPSTVLPSTTRLTERRR